MNGSGFVRAVALVEPSLLGRQPSREDPAVAVIDEVRRHGTKMILLSDRSAAELRRDSTDLLRHFDRVVARKNRREALLEVLQELDVDPHDALGGVRRCP
jgi:hypothetical protein